MSLKPKIANVIILKCSSDRFKNFEKFRFKTLENMFFNMFLRQYSKYVHVLVGLIENVTSLLFL